MGAGRQRNKKKKNHWGWQHSRDGLPISNHNPCVCHADFLHCASHLSACLPSLLYGFNYLKLPTLLATSFESSLNGVKHRDENWWNVWFFSSPVFFFPLKKTEDTGDLIYQFPWLPLVCLLGRSLQVISTLTAVTGSMFISPGLPSSGPCAE